MADRQFDDETLMAFADGELDAATRAAVAAAMERDEGVAGRVHLFQSTRRLLKAQTDDGPVAGASALEERIRALAARKAQERAPADGAADVVVLARRRQAPRRSALSSWPFAMAASIAAAAIAGVTAYELGQRSADGASPSFAFEDPRVERVLASAPSGSEVAVPSIGVVRMVTTFRDASGQLCREYEVERDTGVLLGVSCRAEDNWSIRFALATPGSAEGTFRPASSTETLDAWLVSTGAGAPLSETEERAALGEVARP